MLNFKKIFVGLLLAVLAGPVAAHSNHARTEPVTQEEASSRADQVVKYLVEREQLDSSWESAGQPVTSQRPTPNGTVWVMRYENGEITDAAKKALFVFVDEMGNVLNANHNGQL